MILSVLILPVFYTLGQRQGLGIGGVKGASDLPWYVAKKEFRN